LAHGRPKVVDFKQEFPCFAEAHNLKVAVVHLIDNSTGAMWPGC
jgi:hypothetical protein